ncbi:hypothetical protein CR159_17395 [Pollutimonas subterranea]|uniref:DUF2933 domain-containing protein n=2 Tax=Pollutimonas subterranea TaxID=2045210 RepID=A0A2N4U0Q4_9BURK|nr:hypothetical protein CR159_17395 [Pollutimonas subterranea]
MKCDMKTMMKTAFGLAVVVAVAYATLPAARGWITASAPFLFFLICPLMMFFMMKGMQSCHKEQKVENNQADTPSSKPLLGNAPLKD